MTEITLQELYFIASMISLCLGLSSGIIFWQRAF
jgi:hypothetical protein